MRSSLKKKKKHWCGGSLFILTCCSCYSSSPGFSWPGSHLLWQICSSTCWASSIPQSLLCFGLLDFASPAFSFSSSPFCPFCPFSFWAWRWGLGREQLAARARLGAEKNIQIKDVFVSTFSLMQQTPSNTSIVATQYLTCVHTWSCNSAKRCARSSSLSELGLLSLSSLSLLGSLSEVEEDEEDEEEEDDEEDVWCPLMDMAVCSMCGSSGILAKRNSKTSWDMGGKKRKKKKVKW